MLVLASMVRYAVRTTGRLLVALGWWLNGTWLLITATEPVSGRWL